MEPTTNTPNYPTEAQLAPVLKRFAEQIRKVAEEAIGAVEGEYLPHLESDTFMNVRLLAQNAIESFLDGTDYDDTGKWFTGICRDKALLRIHELNRDEIESRIGDALRRKIELLEIQLQNAWRRQ